MSIADSMLPEFDQEMAGLRKVLERVPDGKSDWKPHEKSMPLARLATHLADLPIWTTNALTKDVLEFTLPQAPHIVHGAKERLELFDKNVKEARAALAAAKDADWPKTWTLKVNGKVAFALPHAAVYRTSAMNHMIHHRAQLGVYLRLRGVPLPFLYGPTADEQMR
ncbi:MAG: DinB family protein [Gemmatimonadales bacterium]